MYLQKKIQSKVIILAKKLKAFKVRLSGANRAKVPIFKTANREKSKLIARKEAKDLQRSFAKCLRRSALKIPKTSEFSCVTFLGGKFKNVWKKNLSLPEAPAPSFFEISLEKKAAAYLSASRTF